MRQQPEELARYPESRPIPDHAREDGGQVRSSEFVLRRPRQWGACWGACQLGQQLQMDEFWQARLPAAREGPEWRHVLQTPVAYRSIAPGSEWRPHREWCGNSALADPLEEDFALAEKDPLARCLDKVWAHRTARFQHLRQRWADPFGVKFRGLLDDLTSAYFERDPPFSEGDKRQFGYSRDKRSECVQVALGPGVTPEGLPLAYEAMAGNTADRTPLKGRIQRIESLHGKAARIWVRDRGLPTEAVRGQMRQSEPPIHYRVGTPKGRLSRYAKELGEKPWQGVREGVQVKLLPQEGELYVLAQSPDRVNKERAMRRRPLEALWARLQALRKMKLPRDALLLKLGAARPEWPAAWRGGRGRFRRRASRSTKRPSALSCARTNYGRGAGAKAGIWGAATAVPRPRRCGGPFTCN